MWISALIHFSGPLIVFIVNLALLGYFVAYYLNNSQNQMVFGSKDRFTGLTDSLTADQTSRAILVRKDCDRQNIFCATSSNCKVLCRPNIATQSYRCADDYRCVTEREAINEESGQVSEVPGVDCNTKVGEIAVLVGYTSLGAAQWECVNLYSAWDPRTLNPETGKQRYCEDGIISFDARVKAPDARSSCTCPEGLFKIVPKSSNFNDKEKEAMGQWLSQLTTSSPSLFVQNLNNFKVPHCVKWPRLYASNYDLLED